MIYCNITLLEHGCKSPKPEDVKLKSAIFSENNSRDETVDKIGVSSSPIKPPLPPDPLEEYRWGENMILIGDTFWRSFQRLDKVLCFICWYHTRIFFPCIHQNLTF